MVVAIVSYFSLFGVFMITKTVNTTNNVIDQYSLIDLFNITNIAVTASNFIPVASGEGATQFVMTSFLNAFKPTDQFLHDQIKDGVFL